MLKPGDNIGLWRVLESPYKTMNRNWKVVCLCTGCGRERAVYVMTLGGKSLGCVSCRNGSRAKPADNAAIYADHKSGMTYRQISSKHSISIATVHRRLLKVYRSRA